MDKNLLQRARIEALKALNNTIVTSRLYPPDAPQVTAGIERGYKEIKQYSRQYGPLQFSQTRENLLLCDWPLSQEVIDSFPNLVIFRQLKILELDRMVIGREMDRFAFRQLVKVFNATVDEIKKAGGGREFVTSLGLASFFPEEPDEQEGENEEKPERRHAVLKVPHELLGCFLHGTGGKEVQQQLREAMDDPGSSIEILSAGIGNLLLKLRKQKELVAEPGFVKLFERAEELIPEERLQQVTNGLAAFLLRSLPESALCVLFTQDFETEFGQSLYRALLAQVQLKTLGEIVVIYRELLARAREKQGEWNVQQSFLGRNFLRLLESDKGKQYLHAEKAQEMIRAGEKERKKKRIEAGIRGLLEGRSEVLGSEELQHYLPEAVNKYLRAGRNEESVRILRTLGEGLLATRGKEQLLDCSVRIGERLLKIKRRDLLDILIEPLKENLLAHRSVTRELRDALEFLQKYMQQCWLEGDNERGDSILYLFHRIRSGEVKSNTPIQVLAGKVQDAGIVRSSLPRMLAQFLANPEDRKVGYRLVLQGPVATRFLVESLIHAEDSRDRMLLIDLLTGFTRFLPQVVHERLPEHMPWFGKRNLIKLLGESGAEEDAEKVAPFLGYDDIRVQREAFLCIYKIGGKRRKELLLKGLAIAGEPVKIQIISALTGGCDQEVAKTLVDLLKEYKFFSDRYRDDLVCQILETLGRCPNPVSQKGVEDFLGVRGSKRAKKLGSRVWEVAEKSRGYLEVELREARKKHLQAGQLRKNALKQAAKLNRLKAGERVISGLPQEQQVRRLLREENTEAAGELLLELIERVARQRNFTQADKLREWLIEIDSSALQRIIRAAEIIDAEKIAAIDRDHLETWARLYDLLAEEEFAAIYHQMHHRKYADGEVVVRQGQMYNSLFFINSGKVKLFYEAEKGNTLIHTLGRGEVFGLAPFFEASSWTVTVAAVGRTELSILKQESLKGWEEDYPGLEPKLRDFCSNFDTIDQILANRGEDRRKDRRHKVSGRYQTHLLDAQGGATGAAARVELADISRGGLSYLTRITRKENVRLLLGRKVRISLPVGETESVPLTGDILAVRSVYAVENDYSVHIRFDSRLKERQLQQIINNLKTRV